MNNNGITYFRLQSPYDGDVTKDCGLTGSEVDNNFFVLEGRDIASVTLNGKVLNITLLNGNVFSVDLSPVDEEIGFEYDKENGVLKITQHGVTQELDGFKVEIPPCPEYPECEDCEECPPITNIEVSTDSTLSGKGSVSNPLGISPLFKTSHYKTVDSFIDVANGETIPDVNTVHVGDRYLVSEKVSKYGYLYNYDSLRQIACDLEAVNSEWRIPTKDDWDDMLNQIEPSEEYKTHNSISANKFLGKFAGKFLKSTDLWRSETQNNSDVLPTCENCPNGDGLCNPFTCAEFGNCAAHPIPVDASGLDLFGFTVKPSGYADDGGLYLYLDERAAFWTATDMEDGDNAYMKRFDYNKSEVYQDIIPTSYSLSIRLVKDYNGSNYFGKENILGNSFDTVIMPSACAGSRVWTSVNLSFNKTKYNPIDPDNGSDELYETKYYLIEWDGGKWLSNLFDEGDVVTIANAPDGSHSTEYKVVEEVLTAVHIQLKNEVINDLSETFDNINSDIESLATNVSNLNNTVAQLRQDLGNEEVERVATDDVIRLSVTELDEKVDNYIEQHDNLANERYNELVDDVNTLTEDLNIERQARIDGDAQLTDDLNGWGLGIQNQLDEFWGREHVQSNSSYDAQTGTLKIGSRSYENDIVLHLGFDFGEV